MAFVSLDTIKRGVLRVQADDFGGGDEIRFERQGKAGLVTLTRPKALNAVTHRMVRALHAALDAWESDDGVKAIVIRGEGRAFSAGGDIMDIYAAGRAGNPAVDFFADEYRLNAAIARYRKPYVALVDGIVMGGGVGVSFHGSHRVMTENAVFAMPEVGIGFFPDVGGSYILPRLPGEFGLYMGLTGNRVRHGDALWHRLATHAVPAAALDELVGAIAESGDPDKALKAHSIAPPRETDDATLHEIGQLFQPDSLDDLIAGLKAQGLGSVLARKTLDTLALRSPTSLHVAFLQIRTGGALTMDECMAMEFRILNRMLAGHDFYEGIRAAIVDKGSTPVWQPATLGEVSEDDVASYFAGLGESELRL